MSTKNLKLEYREYKLPEDFPLLVMTPPISTAPAWVEEPKLHFHNCIEIGLMHGENHSLSFENHTYPLQPGDFFVLSPYSMHYVNHTDGTKSHCCDYLYFNPEILLQAFYPVAVPEEMHWYQNSQVPFLFSRERNPEIYSLLLLILETHRQRNTSPHLQQNILQGLVLALMGSLTRALSSPASGSSQHTLSPPASGSSSRALSSPASGSKYRSLSSLLPALHVLHTEYAKALTPTHLAKCCGLSLSAFRTSFTEQLGESPVLYLRGVRLGKPASSFTAQSFPFWKFPWKQAFPPCPISTAVFKTAIIPPPETGGKQTVLFRKKELSTLPLPPDKKELLL